MIQLISGYCTTDNLRAGDPVYCTSTGHSAASLALAYVESALPE
ncbi:hypothetical protein [Spirosoma sp.]|nr:hypothetical protein [Spirosoma sp.]MCX6217551.1 hypothetical protein [Spirosoma sp.]